MGQDSGCASRAVAAEADSLPSGRLAINDPCCSWRGIPPRFRVEPLADCPSGHFTSSSSHFLSQHESICHRFRPSRRPKGSCFQNKFFCMKIGDFAEGPSSARQNPGVWIVSDSLEKDMKSTQSRKKYKIA